MPTGTLRDNDIVGAIADAIAKNVGKLTPQVIRKDEKGMTIKNDYLARLLKLRPCPEMSTYDFLYRIASDLVYTSNSFSVIFYNEDFTRITSIQPITTKSYRIFEDDRHNILFRFRWDYDGETYTVPYQNVIHIKARYNKKRFLGTSPDLELKRSLDLIETSGETVKNIVNRSNSLAGYLRYNNLADNEELKKIAKDFQDAYMNADNAGGIAAIDSTVEFKEIAQRTPNVPTNQITFLRDNVYRYYGVNEKVLTSTLSDQEWITQTWHCPSLPSRFRLLDLGPDIGGLEPEQIHCPGRTGYILESRRSRPETTISNSAIRKARTETETRNRFIDKTSNRVVYFEKQGREEDPSPKRKS